MYLNLKCTVADLNVVVVLKFPFVGRLLGHKDIEIKTVLHHAASRNNRVGPFLLGKDTANQEKRETNDQVLQNKT
jgi:hypothetical protein